MSLYPYGKRVTKKFLEEHPEIALNFSVEKIRTPQKIKQTHVRGQPVILKLNKGA